MRKTGLAGNEQAVLCLDRTGETAPTLRANSLWTATGMQPWEGFLLETRLLPERGDLGSAAPEHRAAGACDPPGLPELLITFLWQDAFSSPHTLDFHFLLALSTYYELI